jgi:LuxR family maltose regulon positive regulatory protein
MTKQEDLQKNIPADRIFLERPRVDRVLEKAFQSHVVTVVAGEGNGKTYAVDSFLRRERRNIIWVQLSERDNLGPRFWENYCGAAARINRKAAKVLAGLGFPESGPQFDRYFTLLKNGIISRESYVIVFDDFHLITSAPVLRHLDRSLAAPVSRNTIVFISRTEPLINNVGLLAKGLLSRITAEDLRFNEEEIGEYCRLCQFPAGSDDVSRIYHDTEGWALAVDLILKEMRAGSGVKEKHVWDQMMNPLRKIEEDMFAGMDRELQKFLIKLSLIEQWPRNLLERLDPGGESIAGMERYTSLIRFDVYLQGFRIHHLFLEFLREKQGNLSPAEIREVHAAGAQWCVENDLMMAAAVHFEQAGNYGGLIRIINSLPALLSGAAAAYFFEILERIIPPVQGPEEDEDLLYLRFILHPRLLMLQGRVEEAVEEYEKGLRCFEARPPGLSRSKILTRICCGMGVMKILFCRYTKDYHFAPWFERSYHHYLETGEALSDRVFQSNLNSYTLQVGNPAAPGEIETFVNALTRAVPFVAKSMQGFLFGTDSLARSELAFFQGDLKGAEQFARQAVYQGREKKQHEVENRGLFFLMRICVHTGGFAEIRNLERQLEAQLENTEYLNRYAIHDIIMGRFYTRIGLIEKIAPWLRGEVDDGEFNGMYRGFDVLIKARCFFVEKDYSAVLRILEEEEKRDNLGSFLVGKLEMAVLEAAAQYHLGEEEEALLVLEKAYAIAAPHNLDMPFVEMGEDMRLLTGAALSREDRRPGQIPRPWLENIRSRASAYGKQVSLAVEQYREEKREEQKPQVYLTRRELEVLAALARGLEREHIAGETGLPFNTIKVIIRDIYRKLGAVNRADAIRIAINHGLVKAL